MPQGVGVQLPLPAYFISRRERFRVVREPGKHCPSEQEVLYLVATVEVMPQTQPIDLTEILEPYLNKWVALSSDQTVVIGSGDTLPEALSEAQRKGAEQPVFMFVPGISGPHVLGA